MKGLIVAFILYFSISQQESCTEKVSEHEINVFKKTVSLTHHVVTRDYLRFEDTRGERYASCLLTSL